MKYDGKDLPEDKQKIVGCIGQFLIHGNRCHFLGKVPLSGFP